MIKDVKLTNDPCTFKPRVEFTCSYCPSWFDVDSYTGKELEFMYQILGEEIMTDVHRILARSEG